MPEFDYDFFVIGAGSGGVRAARMASGFGANVAIAEDTFLGGTCVNAGCVPKKLFVYASHFAEEFHHAEGFGWTLSKPAFDWAILLTKKNDEIKRLNGIYEEILKNAGVKIIDDHARLIDPNTVAVGDKHITAERILIATGGWPLVADIPGKEHIITSNEAFYLDKLPEKIVIAGGGYIAVEFAGIFHGMGVDTTLLYRGSLFMRGFDHDLRTALAEEMRKKGINLMFGNVIDNIKKDKDTLTATLDNGYTLTADQIMFAIGRRPRTKGLGLETLGIETSAAGGIKVNDQYQTNIPSIYAIGDVTDRIQLTPVALAEGMVLAKRLYAKENKNVDYEDIPTCVFSQPNLGTVGLTEEQARERYAEIEIYKSRFTPMKLSLTDSDEKTLMKIIVDKATDRVVGVHMLGPDAGEVIQGIGIAIKAGATKTTFDTTIGIHPTSAEEFVTMREPVQS